MKFFRGKAPATLAAACVPLFGLLVVLRGPDFDWDFRNYHWYNAYAWLTGRRGFDIAVAHHATYYNPLPDVPVFMLAQVLPPWCVGFLVGCVHGLNLLLLYHLACAMLDAASNSKRNWLALAVALAGTTGGMALMLVGNASNDMTLSLPVLLALLFMARAGNSPGTTNHGLWHFGAAGLAGGIAAGLKLTMAPFAVGLAAGALMLKAPARIRLRRFTALVTAGLVGGGLCGGVWAFTLWSETGNPFFPYFNDIIGSPLLLDASYRDPRFLPENFIETLLYPLLFAWDGTQVHDMPFRDIKIALAYLIVPTTLLWMQLSQRAQLTQSMRLLFTVCSVSYALWLLIFGVYRYVLTLELLAPLLIALAVSVWPVGERRRLGALAAIWVLAILGTGWGPITAVGGAWRDTYVDITAPSVADPSRTLAVMAGVAPMGYIVPAFPPQIPFLRIDGWLDTPQSGSAFGDRMRARIDAHGGPVFGVFVEWERARAIAAFKADGLLMTEQHCTKVESGIGQPVLWCALQKTKFAD